MFCMVETYRKRRKKKKTPQKYNDKLGYELVTLGSSTCAQDPFPWLYIAETQCLIGLRLNAARLVMANWRGCFCALFPLKSVSVIGTGDHGALGTPRSESSHRNAFKQ